MQTLCYCRRAGAGSCAVSAFCVGNAPRPSVAGRLLVALSTALVTHAALPSRAAIAERARPVGLGAPCTGPSATTSRASKRHEMKGTDATLAVRRC